MIIDRLENFSLYKNSCPHLEKAVNLIKKLESLEVGRYEDGEIYGMVQEMQSAPLSEKNFEAHIKYIDIHYIVDGVEVIDWQIESALEPVDEYNTEKDIRFYKGQGTPVVLNKGMFCITFPTDAHKPCCYLDNSCNIRKVVIKIPAL